MNPSFEEPDCDGEPGQFFYPAMHWYNVILSGPDYYSTSFEPGECLSGVPLGDQVPRSGTFMAGLWGSQTNSPTRDYIQSRLSEPMIQDSIYCIGMYVLRIESSPLAINRFGVQLSQDSLYDFSTSEVLLGGVLLSSPVEEFLSDAENWMHLSWEYQAQGGEEYITLGNFWEESELEYLDVVGTDKFPVAYYHVDDVSVVQCVSTSLSEEDMTVSIGPNPVSEFLNVSSNSSPVNWTIYSLEGRIIRRGSLLQSGRISLLDLSPSVYLFELKDKSGRGFTELIVKD